MIYEGLYSKRDQQEFPRISQFGKEAVGGGGLLPSVPGQGQSGGAFVDKRLFNCISHHWVFYYSDDLTNC